MTTLNLVGATVPDDAKVPGTLSRWVALFEQVFTVVGAETLNGVIIQNATPDPSDQDKAWVKLTAGGAVEGWYRFNGDWIAFPMVIPTLDSLPASPQAGQIVIQGGAIKVYQDGSWTTNFTHAGATADRPSSPATDYLFFDETIGRLLRWTGSAWTTNDGCLGELKLLAGVSEAEAITRNPGWAAYPLAYDKFLRIGGGDIGDGSTGGRESFDWKISREYFEWGTGPGTDGNLGTDNVHIDGNQGTTVVDSAGESEPDSSNNWQDTFTVNTVPPFLGVIMIRKETN